MKVSSVAAATAIMEGANIMANGAPLATDYAGVREYIGARYVPVFANPLAWSDQREYEPLTIVTYQGNSYTSTQYVPTGVDIGNTEFWALTGNYNAQVEGYRKEVANYQKQVNEYKEQVNEFDGRITDNAQEIANVKSITDRSETIIFGDSWSDPNFQYAWPKYYRSFNTVHNYAKGGAGYVHSTGTPFIQQIEAANTDESFENKNVTEIIIVLGANDYSENYATVVTNANNGFSKIKDYWPNAKVRIGWNFCFNQQPRTNIYQTINNVAMAALQNGLTFDWKIMELMMNGRASEFYQDDKVHPSEKGAKIIAAYMEGNGNVNGWCNIENFLTVGENPSGVSNHAVIYSNMRISDGKISIHYTSAFTLSTSTNQPIVLAMPISPDVNLYIVEDNPEAAIHVGSNKVVGTLTKIGNILYTVIKPLSELEQGSYQVRGNAVWQLA